MILILEHSLIFSDPSAFLHVVQFVGANVVTMWGPDGWEHDLPVFSYLTKYNDCLDVLINVDQRIGGTWEKLEEFAWKLGEPLGRIPIHSRSGTKRIDVNYGKYKVLGNVTPSFVGV